MNFVSLPKALYTLPLSRRPISSDLTEIVCQSQWRMLEQPRANTNWPNCPHYFLLLENVLDYKIGTMLPLLAPFTGTGIIFSIFSFGTYTKNLCCDCRHNGPESWQERTTFSSCDHLWLSVDDFSMHLAKCTTSLNLKLIETRQPQDDCLGIAPKYTSINSEMHHQTLMAL